MEDLWRLLNQEWVVGCFLYGKSWNNVAEVCDTWIVYF